MTKRRPRISKAAFAKTPRSAVTMRDVERAVGQVLRHPDRPVTKSENREPTKAELNRRWKLTR